MEAVNNAFKKVKEEFDQDPLKVILVGSIAATAAAKLLNALSAAQGRRAYARQVKYRVRQGL